MNQFLFTKTEIDLLLERARSGQPVQAGTAPAPTVEPFDFQGVNRLSANQIAKLLELHADFAKRLGRSLSTLLGPECKTTPLSVELMMYDALVTQSPGGALFETLRIQAPEGSVLLLADLSSVLPMVDLLLGGLGTAAETIRPLSQIEWEIFKPIIDMVGAELQATWAPFLETSLHFEHCGPAANLLPATERVSSVKFEIQIGELRGTWVLVLPMLVSNVLIRKLEQELSKSDVDGSEQNRQRLKERLLDSKFALELLLPPSGVSVRKLAHLKTGQVLALKIRSNAPVHFHVAGINLFHASPVSCGSHRGAQIKRTLSILENEGKEAQ